jgi:hypothetical protein
MPAKGRYSSNLNAARATISALEGAGRVPEGHALLVTNLLTLAGAVDARPTAAILRKEYREAADALLKAFERNASDEGDLISGMFAAVGDTTTAGTADARPASRRSSASAGDAVHAVATVDGGRRPGVAA